MKKIYLDYASTTPIDKEVLKKAEPYLSSKFGNPSSLHSFGQEALFAIDNARKRVAKFLNSKEREVVFTPSATISNNLAIMGVLSGKSGAHAITSKIEHKAVIEPLSSSGAEVIKVGANRDGIIRVEDIRKAIREETALISIMYVNSEIGTIQKIREIGEMIEEVNKERKNKIIFHTDAVQAVNYLSCDVKELKVDLLTLSGHKIYGPKGVGALFVREGVALSPSIFGASQEKGLSPGTENIFAIAGLGFAIEEIERSDNREIKRLREKLINGVLSSVSGSKLNGSREERILNNANFSFEGVEGESLLIALDMEGIAASTGSACASSSLSPSSVLLAIGLSHEEAHSSLRVTLGRFTKEEEIDYFLEKLPPIVAKLRKIAGR